VNHGFDPRRYLDAIPTKDVQEIHLAGHLEKQVGGVELLIDTHDRPVKEAVWDLYRYALETLGPKPTLIEWDSALPELTVLLGEADKAEAILRRHHAAAA